jgi:hypothetical protein
MTVERAWSGLNWLRIGPSGVFFMNAAMNFRIPQNTNNLLTDEEILVFASEEELRFM